MKLTEQERDQIRPIWDKHTVTNLLCPNTMQVEGGFSDMKMTETLHQANLTLPTYNAMRQVRSYFKDIKYETFVIPQYLVSRVKKASANYMMFKKEKSVENKVEAILTKKLKDMRFSNRKHHIVSIFRSMFQNN